MPVAMGGDFKEQNRFHLHLWVKTALYSILIQAHMSKEERKEGRKEGRKGKTQPIAIILFYTSSFSKQNIKWRGRTNMKTKDDISYGLKVKKHPHSPFSLFHGRMVQILSRTGICTPIIDFNSHLHLFTFTKLCPTMPRPFG